MHDQLPEESTNECKIRVRVGNGRNENPMVVFMVDTGKNEMEKANEEMR